MIGLSVTRCIQDMIEGRVEKYTVKKIIGGTSITPDVVDDVMRRYREIWWKADPDQAEQIFRSMFAAGTIEQPALENPNRYPIYNRGQHWVTNEIYVVWSDEVSDEELKKYNLS